MKYTLATLALTGAVSAHKQHHCIKQFFGIDPKHESCPNMDHSKNMEDFEFGRTMHRTVSNALLKGWYQDSRTTLVGEKCGGAWMDFAKDNMVDLAHKIHHGDIWNISPDQLKTAQNDLVDMFFVNADECGTMRVIEDSYNWCMDNIHECYQLKGLENRVMEQGMNIIGQAWELYNIFTTDDMCFTDED
mgnify:FL=1